MHRIALSICDAAMDAISHEHEEFVLVRSSEVSGVALVLTDCLLPLSQVRQRRCCDQYNMPTVSIRLFI